VRASARVAPSLLERGRLDLSGAVATRGSRRARASSTAPTNPTGERGGIKSSVDDLGTGRGVVISRAASLLRSIETRPQTGRFVRLDGRIINKIFLRGEWMRRPYRDLEKKIMFEESMGRPYRDLENFCLSRIVDEGSYFGLVLF
jgi:hypothetical protein